MKYFIVTLALTSSMSFAAEVDYSRCGMFASVQLDHDGKVVPNQFQKIKSQGTSDNLENIVFEYSFGNQKIDYQVTLERDAQGRVIKATTGGDRPSARTLKQYREMMVNGAVMMAPMSTGSFAGANDNGFMSQEPSYWVKRNKAATTEQVSTGGTAGGMVGGSMGGSWGVAGGMVDPNYEMVPLSKLTKEQAKTVGIEDAEELKRLRKQWKRDKKTMKKLRDGYTKIVDRSALVIPMGSEAEFEIQDGVCLPKSLKSRLYNSQSGQVNTIPVSSKESCEKIQTVYKRHERKINECQAQGQKVTQDYFKEMYPQGGMVAGVQGGYVTGGVGGMYPAGGMAGGGMVGGYMGGMGGMGMGGMYGGYGMPFMGMGMDMNSIAMQNMMCEFTYNRPQQPEIRQTSGGSAAGSGSEVQQQ